MKSEYAEIERVYERDETGSNCTMIIDRQSQ